MSWFASWFDSPYYHRLYQHRNDAEAAAFIRKLSAYLELSPADRLLDMACGRGRHSLQLAQQGYEVLGIDLSPESIAFATEQAQGRLSFGVWDMRQSFAEQFGKFDVILNLFTSFGYFETEAEHLHTLQNMAAALQHRESRLVMDFFNASRSIRDLVLSEQKTVDGIDFQLERYVKNGYIIKNIRFQDTGESFYFQEKVRAFGLSDFEQLFAKAGLKIVDTFGNYNLQPFDKNTSDRLVLIAKRKD